MHNNHWVDFTAPEQIDEILTLSDKQLVAVFKHSTRCGISKMVLERFKNTIAASDIVVYYLDLLNYRDLSNKIASDFEVVHQSPQLIIFKEGKVVSNASHHDILKIDYKEL